MRSFRYLAHRLDQAEQLLSRAKRNRSKNKRRHDPGCKGAAFSFPSIAPACNVIAATLQLHADTRDEAARAIRLRARICDRWMLGAHPMSDFEVNPVGTADELMRFRADPASQQIARLTCALMLNQDTIRDLSEKRHVTGTTSERQLFVAARVLRESFGLAPAEARRYAKAALEAAASVNPLEGTR
jgi:hypothetical protein